MKLSDYGDEKSGGVIDKDAQKFLKKILDRYEGQSEDKLIASVLSIAAKKRAEGTLTDAELDGFRDMIAKSLNDEQKKKLDALVKMLKEKS